MESKTNPNTVMLARELRRLAGENGAPIWKAVAVMLEKPEARWTAVNVSKVDRLSGGKSHVIVLGKLLGDGEIRKPVKVTAFRFSASAKKKVADSGGTIMSLLEMAKENPKGSGIIIIR